MHIQNIIKLETRIDPIILLNNGKLETKIKPVIFQKKEIKQEIKHMIKIMIDKIINLRTIIIEN
jgi:peptide deformylase